MLNNKQIAGKFDLLAKLMELHDENPFKIKSYANAYLSLRKLEGDLATISDVELAKIPGIGSAIVDKIKELVITGEMTLLNKYQDLTPVGIQELLSIKGLGPKKVKQIWKEMEITTVGELLYACNENRLVAYKGFGYKLQDEIKGKLEYYIGSRGWYLYAHVHKLAENFLGICQKRYPEMQFALCGDVRRSMPEVKGIEILSTIPYSELVLGEGITEFDEEKNQHTFHNIPIHWHQTSLDVFQIALFNRSASSEFLESITIIPSSAKSETEIFNANGVHVIPPECRESKEMIDFFRAHDGSELIETKDILGIVHNHSTYSDGLHSLKDMSDYVRSNGYSYFVISDHSKSAGYANGLKEERVFEQMAEIDKLNSNFGDDFYVYKSIESDILSDGSLDYEESVLKCFDLVIASIHSGLHMDIDKATSRLIKAVENPYTRILGHPTSRLILARPGYPLDHRKLLDACAANGVAMELNANPQRLDIDWTWIPYAMEKGVLISINPDAHSKESIHYVQYGVQVARKGGLIKSNCLNTKTKNAFDEWLGER